MSIWFGDVSSDVYGEVSGDYRPPHRDGHSSLRSSGAPCPRSFLVTIAMPANRHIHSQNFHRAWWISEQSQISSLNSLLFELTLRFDAENSSHHGHQFLGTKPRSRWRALSLISETHGHWWNLVWFYRPAALGHRRFRSCVRQ